MYHGRMMSTKEWLVPRPLGFAGGEVDVVFSDDPGAGDTREEEADLVIIWGLRPGGDERTAPSGP